MVKFVPRRLLSVARAMLGLLLREIMQWFRVIVLPCQFHLFFLERASSIFSFHQRTRPWPNVDRLPVRNHHPLSLHPWPPELNELYCFYLALWIWEPHPIFFGGQGTLARFIAYQSQKGWRVCGSININIWSLFCTVSLKQPQEKQLSVASSQS